MPATGSDPISLPRCSLARSCTIGIGILPENPTVFLGAHQTTGLWLVPGSRSRASVTGSTDVIELHFTFNGVRLPWPHKLVNKARPWTPEEDFLIRTRPPGEAATLIGVSCSIVHRRRKLLGVGLHEQLATFTQSLAEQNGGNSCRR